MTKNIKLFLTTTNNACILMKKIKVSNKKKIDCGAPSPPFTPVSEYVTLC